MPRIEKAPAFQVYAADDLADAQTMTDAQFGTWSRLRAMAWRDVGIPADPEQLAAICRVTPKALPKLWAVIGVQWVERDGRYVLPWMEAQRERQAERRERNAENGRNGGRPKKPEGNPPPNRNGTHKPTHAEPNGLAKSKPNESSSSFSLQASSTASPPPPSARATETADSAVRPRVPAEYRPDLDALLERIAPPQRLAWLRSLAAKLDGLHGPAVAPDVLGEALRQYTANGAEVSWKLFVGYLRVAAAPPPAVVPVALVPANGHPPNGTNGQRPTRTDRVVERSIQGTRAALAALKGRTG